MAMKMCVRTMTATIRLVAIAISALFALAQPGESAVTRTDDPKPLDRSRAKTQPGEPTLWYDARELGIEGRGWSDTKSFFDRLPARAETIVRAPVWGLSQNSAGMCVHFATDATTIAVRWTLRSKNLAMPHMPATGVSGVDLYTRDPSGVWRWLAAGRPTEFPTNQQTLIAGLPAGKHECLLYLPLYNGVESVEIGIGPDSTITPVTRYDNAAKTNAPAAQRPICFYGTSITQGGCASRPGMAYPAIIGRRLHCPTINLGFSGNGRMEPEMAELLSELDPAAFVLDCLPNLDEKGVRERTEPVIHQLRRARPDTPIVLVENISYQNQFVLPASRERSAAKNTALAEAYERLRSSGTKGLYYVPGAALLGDDGEATVDGTHPTDLGFQRMADVLGPVLEPLTRKAVGSRQ
jgi:lysophospholipase L1-like esterase